MATITVGSGEQYSTISAAVAASSSGDTIDVDAGTYTNDFPTISQNLTLQAVGGAVTMVATQDPPNGKAIIDEGGAGVNITINGFDLSGAQVPDGNGAGIRYEGGNLTLNNDTIRDNQDGLLSASDPNGTITINGSTVTNNGTGSGSTHNIYVGDIANLTVQNSTITAAAVGHDIKSRAENTTITNNTIEDGPNGTSSYEIDLPNGGNTNIQGNVIEKGPNAQNPTAISFGEEGSVHANSSLTVQNNTMLNDDTAHNTYAVVNDTGTTATVTGNSLYGWTTVASGPATVSGNATLATEPALSSLTPGGAVTSVADTSSTAASATANTATSTPATTSSDASATTADPSASTAGTPASTTAASALDTSTAASTTSQNSSAPISATTVGTSSSSPTFIAGDASSGSQQSGSGTASTPQTSSLDTSGTGSLASLAQGSGAPLDFMAHSSSPSTTWDHANGPRASQGWAGHLQTGGNGTQSLIAPSGQHATSGLPTHISSPTV